MTASLAFAARMLCAPGGGARSGFGGAVMGAAALSLALLVGNAGSGRAESGIALKLRELAQLKSMDSGTQAEILVKGLSAQARNDLIPTSQLPVERMGHFAVIEASSPQYSSAERCLTQAVYYEAANEPLQGKRAVAQVVLNRLRHPAYPNSVCGVVYEGVNDTVCQFSFTCDGSLLRQPMARQWNESRKVAAQALAGTVETAVGSATHYHADYVLPRWAFTLAKIEKIGAHVFYRFPGRAGREAAFTRDWAGYERLPFLSDERLRQMLVGRYAEVVAPAAPELVPGLTVAPHVTDRHAPADVGGRIDTTKGWRLSIPDPVNRSATGGGISDASAEAAGSAAVRLTEAGASK